MEKPAWVDTHSHLFVEEFDEDREQAVERAQEAGVAHLYLPNIDAASLPRLLRMAEDYPGYVSPMIGLHPTSVSKDYQKDLDFLYRSLCERNGAESNASFRYMGIGEIGIDLYWDDSLKKEQENSQILLNSILRKQKLVIKIIAMITLVVVIAGIVLLSTIK